MKTFAPLLQRLVALLALCAVPILVTGCKNPRFKLVKEEDRIDPIPFGLKAEDENLATELVTLIVFQGPGSWKMEANWDEYVLAFKNQTEGPLIIASPTLYDFEDTPLSYGLKPWDLDKLSRSREDVLNERGMNVLKGSMVGVGVIAGTYAYGWAAMSAWFSAASTASINTALAGAAVGIIVIPGMYGYSLLKNRSNRKQVEAIFAERTLVFPLSLEAGETVAGSVFFPFAPGPQRLELPYETMGLSKMLTVDLTPLANLHFDIEVEDED